MAMGCSALGRQLSPPLLLPAGTPSKNELNPPLRSPAIPPILQKEVLLAEGHSKCLGWILGIGAMASWFGNLTGKLINVKARKSTVNQKGNEKPSSGEPKMWNSYKMIQPAGPGK